MKILLALLWCSAVWAQSPLEFLNHGRPLLDAHNCYPYEGRWADRIDRALRASFPVGIEQDLAWFVDLSGKGRLVVSHTSKTNGSEPTLKDYFFEHVRPVVERALRENNRSAWPLIIQLIIGLVAALSIAAAWWFEGRKFASGRTLLGLPFYVLWKLPMYAVLVRRGAPKEWLRTGR